MQVNTAKGSLINVKDLATKVYDYDSLNYVYEARIAYIDSMLKVVNETARRVQNELKIVKKENISFQDEMAATIHSYDSLNYVYEARITSVDSMLNVVNETVGRVENKLKIVKKDSINIELLYVALVLFAILILLSVFYGIWKMHKKHISWMNLQKELLSDLQMIKKDEGVIRDISAEMPFINEKLGLIHNHQEQIENELFAMHGQLREVRNIIPEFSSSVISGDLNKRLSQQSKKVSLTKYNDAVNAFVALNDRLYAFKKHRSVVLPCMRLLAGDKSINAENVRAQIAQSSLKSEDKASFSLLLNDISQFVSTYVSVIDKFLEEADDIDCHSFLECIRMPLGEMFNVEKDEHALGEEFTDSDQISDVLRLGFYFPQSTTQPYRTKSLIL